MKQRLVVRVRGRHRLVVLRGDRPRVGPAHDEPRRDARKHQDRYRELIERPDEVVHAGPVRRVPAHDEREVDELHRGVWAVAQPLVARGREPHPARFPERPPRDEAPAQAAALGHVVVRPLHDRALEHLRLAEEEEEEHRAEDSKVRVQDWPHHRVRHRTTGAGEGEGGARTRTRTRGAGC
eukprot:30879-Pelagococcus_subviridis.AAC.6